jgi:hypothetical protein
MNDTNVTNERLRGVGLALAACAIALAAALALAREEGGAQQPAAGARQDEGPLCVAADGLPILL